MTKSNNLPELFEQTDEAAVTREAFFAEAFMEDFSDRFAEAELSEDQLFLLSIQEFDKWLMEVGELPPDNDVDPIFARGRGAKRQEIRAMINRAAEFGKTIWPPFSIKSNKRGINYEIRLMTKHLEKMPDDLAARTRLYMENQLVHWSRIGKLMRDEKITKRAPAQFMKFIGIERSIELTLTNMVGALGNLNIQLIAAARDARKFLASMPGDGTGEQL
jgi:hypothetical protein